MCQIKSRALGKEIISATVCRNGTFERTNTSKDGVVQVHKYKFAFAVQRFKKIDFPNSLKMENRLQIYIIQRISNLYSKFLRVTRV